MTSYRFEKTLEKMHDLEKFLILETSEIFWGVDSKHSVPQCS